MIYEPKRSFVVGLLPPDTKHSARDGKYHSVGRAVVRDKHPCLDSVLKRGVGGGHVRGAGLCEDAAPQPCGNLVRLSEQPSN